MQRYTDILSELKTIEDKVAWLLERYPELRDKSYNYLISKFWNNFDNLQASPEYIAKLTPMETISRCKRKLAQKNPEKYGPTKPEHIENIGKRFVAFQEWAVGK